MIAEMTDIREEIVRADDEFTSVFGQGDAASLADLYTTTGQVLPPNGEFVSGREAIQSFWQGVMKSGLNACKLDTIEIERHGDTAVEVGAFTLFVGDRQPVDNGKYIVIWKQEDGKWRLHRDIFNSSRPASQ